MSRDVPIEKIRSNTEFKLRFTSPATEELASSLKEWLRVYGRAMHKNYWAMVTFIKCRLLCMLMSF
jgi:hypothetical protein